MNFADLARARAQLHQKVLHKEAGVIGMMAKGVTAPLRWGARSAIKRHGKVMGGLMVGGAALGTAAVAGSAVGKSREYNRGFDPRIQNASMQRVR